MKNEYTIKFNWDDEAKVWIAISNDIIGLILESESVEKLMNRVKLAAPELIELITTPDAKDGITRSQNLTPYYEILQAAFTDFVTIKSAYYENIQRTQIE